MASQLRLAFEDACYHITSYTMRNKVIAKLFGGIKDTAVSKVVSRMKQKLTYDKELR